MIRPSDYIDNLGTKLPKEVQEEILFKVNHFQPYSDYCNGYRRALADVGIKLAYGWTHHREEWFFPTYEEAEMEWDYRNQCAD